MIIGADPDNVWDHGPDLHTGFDLAFDTHHPGVFGPEDIALKVERIAGAHAIDAGGKNIYEIIGEEIVELHIAVFIAAHIAQREDVIEFITRACQIFIDLFDEQDVIPDADICRVAATDTQGLLQAEVKWQSAAQFRFGDFGSIHPGRTFCIDHTSRDAGEICGIGNRGSASGSETSNSKGVLSFIPSGTFDIRNLEAFESGTAESIFHRYIAADISFILDHQAIFYAREVIVREQGGDIYRIGIFPSFARGVEDFFLDEDIDVAIDPTSTTSASTTTSAAIALTTTRRSDDEYLGVIARTGLDDTGDIDEGRALVKRNC